MAFIGTYKILTSHNNINYKFVVSAPDEVKAKDFVESCTLITDGDGLIVQQPCTYFCSVVSVEKLLTEIVPVPWTSLSQDTDFSKDNVAEEASCYKRLQWTAANTKLLITLRYKIDEKLNPTGRKKKLWDSVSLKMKQRGVYVSGPDCSEKFRNLMATYKKNKDKLAKSGAEASNWEYFDAMDMYFGDKVFANPPAGNLLASMEADDAQEKAPLKNKVTDVETEGDTAIERSIKMRKVDERWEEYKRLEERKIQAIGRLTSVLEKFLNRVK